MNFSSSLQQIYFYLTISFITSFVINFSRTNTLPIIADPLEKIEEIEQINEKMSNPIIREISIDIAKDLFDVISKGVVKIEINQKYPLSDAKQAHIDIEERKTTGSTILIVD